MLNAFNPPVAHSRVAPRFGNSQQRFVPLPPVTAYAQEVPGGNPYLKLYRTQPEGFPHAWMFAHREVGKGGVHTFTIVTKPDGQQVVHLLITRRPPLGGDLAPLAIENPAGIWADENENEDLAKTAEREVREETGYQVDSVRLLANQLFATSPGMCSEMKGLAIARVSGTPSQEHFQGEENRIIVGKLEVPLETFL
jgi:8-oxo-dGTP pyrophosphatase MutT (NUDIX family)